MVLCASVLLPALRVHFQITEIVGVASLALGEVLENSAKPHVNTKRGLCL